MLVENEKVISDEAFVIEGSRVGLIRKGDFTKQLYDGYGKSSVTMLAVQADTTLQDRRNYFVYAQEQEKTQRGSGEEKEGVRERSTNAEQGDKVLDVVPTGRRRPLFVAMTPAGGENQGVIENIVILSKRMRTSEGINMESTVEEIRSSYPDATVLQHSEKVYIYIPTEDLYFEINQDDIPHFNPDFIVEIPIENIRGTAVPVTMSVNWYAQEIEMFSERYWRELLRVITNWFSRVSLH